MKQGDPIVFLAAHRIHAGARTVAVAFPFGTEPPSSGGPTGGGAPCSGCLGDFLTCDAACQNGGFAAGVCVDPASTDPNTCCECSGSGGPEPDCSGCLVGASSCAEACQNLGFNSVVALRKHQSGCLLRCRNRPRSVLPAIEPIRTRERPRPLHPGVGFPPHSA